VSVGHRPTLVRFHSRVLQLAPDGSWRVSSPEEYAAVTAAAAAGGGPVAAAPAAAA
jgi:ABC-type uncharacterized transport system fused permease/ATPase subunit